jgi:3-oxoadipate enol-lactonase
VEVLISKTIKIGPHPYISVDYYGQGEAVFLLHGIGGNKRNWDDNVLDLAKYHKVITWDTRGYGASDDYNGAFKFSDAANDLFKVFDFFGIDRAHIIGLSMGARIACWFYDKYPERVKSLVLCDTNFGSKGFSEDEKKKFINSRTKPLKEGKTFKDFSYVVARSLIGDKQNEGALQKLIDSLNLLRKESYLKTVDSFAYHDNLDCFSNIKVPSLVLVGELDRLTPPKVAEKIFKKIEGARFYIVKGAGHLINIEKPEIFNNYVIGFLRDMVHESGS